MKELSIEEKAKRYDEAYKKVAIRFGSNVADEIFLKESEDERIRKELIGFVKSRGGFKQEYIAWLEKQGNLMKALQISNANIGELIEKNYYLKEQLEKQGKNNMGISEATKKKLEDNLNKALQKETPESWNKFLDEQGEQKPAEEYNITGIGSKHATGKLAEKIKELESLKQSEQKPIKEHNACEFCEDRYGCVSPCPMKLIEEEKYTDNTEPKFREGDWVVYCGKTYQITGLNNDTFTITGCDSGYFFNMVKSTHEPVFHLWTIQDAKDGDVLACENDIVIFKENNYNPEDKSGCMFVYCSCNNFYEIGGINPTNYKPATKEQRDFLFQKMKEAGYEWNAEKKELKKVEKKKDIHNKLTAFEFSLKHIIEEAIECGDIRNLKNDADLLLRIARKTSWNEEDEENLNWFEKFFRPESLITKCKDIPQDKYLWFKSLKDRVQPQKQEWSDVDKDILFQTIDNLKFLRDTISIDPKYAVNIIDTEREINWLNSLNSQSTWKPSDKQMDALNDVISSRDIKYDVLSELWKELKKLKEE